LILCALCSVAMALPRRFRSANLQDDFGEMG